MCGEWINQAIKMSTRVSLGRRMGRHSRQPWECGVGGREDWKFLRLPELGFGAHTPGSPLSPPIHAPVPRLPVSTPTSVRDSHCPARQCPPRHQAEQQLPALALDGGPRLARPFACSTRLPSLPHTTLRTRLLHVLTVLAFCEFLFFSSPLNSALF